MKRWILFAGIVLLGTASVVISERQKVDVPASPAALLYLVADTEQELTRMPVSFARMPDAEEIRIGNELARFYSSTEEQNNNTSEAAIVEHYLTRVGSELASRAHRKLPYRFHYIPNPNMVNAFALPGGHVYVGGGVLSLMDSEDELAAVIGHEIEHIDHYHCSDRAQQEQALRKLPLGGLVALPIEVFEAGYSKDQELEADREGTRLAVKAGYSANGAVRMFETFERLQKEYQAKAKTPQEELSQVAWQTLEGYFRSHPLPSERIAQVQKMIASEGWSPHSERDLRIVYLFRTAKAQSALDARKYAQAEQLANQSLRLRPDQPRAFQVLAQAQFAQANFSGAAAAYHKILETGSALPEIIVSYAQALAAADRKSAASEFRRWADSAKGEKPREAEVAAAGLGLLAGDSGSAHKLEIELKQSGDPRVPVWLGELGWWHYLNGDYEKSVELVSEGVQQRPGDLNLGRQLAWTQIEIRRYGDALQTLDSLNYERRAPPEKAIIQAVAHWKALERDEAMGAFDTAIASQPEWENPNWVKALYSPLVAQSTQEMQAERERRRQKIRAVASH
ncbi:MAG TPA: M48 family metalloprotease [Candidatus Acidoferrum sp.]|jgi:predicted Zn-dependent protease|nr:M48 family metalloprotease [Candidatus Acidoferrum sp.]